MISYKKSIAEVPVYVPGKPIEDVLRTYNLTSAIKLASNENPYGYSPRVKAAIEQNLDAIFYYPDGGATLLREKLAEFLQVDGEQVIFGAGLDEVIQMISRAFLEKHTNTIIATPSFPNYKINAMIEGADIREVPLLNGVHNLLEMGKLIDEQTRIIWICNPNNPTGTYLPSTQLRSFIEDVPPEVLVVLDEAYYEYVVAEDYENTIPWIAQLPNLIVLRTFSKAYGLAGLRIGYGVAHPDVVAIINKVRKPFNTSLLAQVAARAAIEDQAFVQETVRQNRFSLNYFYNELNRLGLSYYPSQTNFVYIDVQQSSAALSNELLKSGIIIRPMVDPYVRISVGLPEHNEQLFHALEKAIKN